MTEQSATTDPKPPTIEPCAKCGSTVHTTGYHDGGVSPEGYHDGGLVGGDFGTDAPAVDTTDGKGIPTVGATTGTDGASSPQGYHDGGSPSR